MGRHREFDENEVLEAALFVFWHRGYDGTSIDNLTQATGVARPGLYAAFGNKEAIFRKALSLYESKYLGFMTEAMSATTTLKVVELMLRGCATLHTLSTIHSGCLGLNGALACSESSEPIRLELVQGRANSQLKLQQRFDAAREDGDLPNDVDSAMLASLVMAIAQGMAVQAKAGASKEALEKMVTHVLSTWPLPEKSKQ